MKKLIIRDIVEVTHGKLLNGSLEAEVKNFCKDTRIIKFGETYIGIKGENFDGNMLWKQAIDKGATTVIAQGVDFTKDELEKFQSVNIIKVEDTIKAISDIAKYKRS